MSAESSRDGGGSLSAAVMLGIGLGAFVDGIVLHQVLGWHHMLSAVRPPTDITGLRLNVVADGMFHVGAWFATLLGVLMLWRAGVRGAMPTARRLAGGLLTGFALFNLVEGVVDHHLLELHNVLEGPNAAVSNYVFLGASALLLVIGLALSRRGRRRPSMRNLAPR